jgi:hypothetical protein
MNDDGTTGETGLSIARNENRTRRRIYDEMRGGAKSLHGIAHRSWLSPDQAAAELSTMMTDGWFKLTTTTTGKNIVTLAEPGEQLVDPDLYCDIISAVRAGADTVTAIAEWLEVDCDDTFIFAVGVSLRIAKDWRGG